ncbi:MAG: hypothetical protein KDC14_06760 [Planctomycetes bacterium]|nr:hypothetical protein [Planctomycetota bacterium]
MLLSLLFPGLGHRSIYAENTTNYYIAGGLSWALAIYLSSLFFLFGVVWLVVPIVHIMAARDAGSHWDFLNGYPPGEPGGRVTIHTTTYGPGGPSVSVSEVDDPRG